MAEELMRWPLVAATLKISRSTAWRLEKAGKFPRRRQISAKSVGWLRSEVEAWAKSLAVVSNRSVCRAPAVSARKAGREV